MKAILRFDLNDPDDREQYETCMKAQQMQMALSDIKEQVFRPVNKYGYPEEMGINTENEDVHAAINKLADLFYQILEERGVNE